MPRGNNSVHFAGGAHKGRLTRVCVRDGLTVVQKFLNVFKGVLNGLASIYGDGEE